MSRPACLTCEGTGEVRHRMYGSPVCPEPWEDCPDCFGTGGELWTAEDQAAIDAMVDEGRGL